MLGLHIVLLSYILRQVVELRPFLFLPGDKLPVPRTDSHLPSRFFQGKGHTRLALTKKSSQRAPAVTSFSSLEFDSQQFSKGGNKINLAHKG